MKELAASKPRAESQASSQCNEREAPKRVGMVQSNCGQDIKLVGESEDVAANSVTTKRVTCMTIVAVSPAPPRI